ncbi:MAG TPA: alpha/beta hydrolase [Sphingomonas sp.]|jgi:pimeloyl-ACP methyl ester carboxylesterase|uniref:alpha/beta fold hydrolase n=1 Tax=Sphingomonas sp. TaxID=28214 RepID=UPI002EDA1457
MTSQHSYPLAPFDGRSLPAPAWYERAVAITPETGRTVVEGAEIEWFAWGPTRAPGLLLLHGGWAHAGWWAHIAPLLADDRRVVAMSLSGMGQSGWRDRYSIPQFAREARAVAEATGLTAAGPPVIVAHSFGCAVAAAAVADPDDWTAGIILIDGSITLKPNRAADRTGRINRPFATVAAALARFRLMPAQDCDNLYIVDAIARRSLRHTDAGFVWSFDPAMFEHCSFIDSRAAVRSALRPVAFIRGARSTIVDPDTLAGLRADLPDARFVTVPDAGHHIMLDQPLALVAAIDALLAGRG